MVDGPSAINSENGSEAPASLKRPLTPQEISARERLVEQAKTDPRVKEKVREAALSGKDILGKLPINVRGATIRSFADPASARLTHQRIVEKLSARENTGQPSIPIETTVRPPPTIEELKADIKPETQKLVNEYKKDTSGRI